MNAGFLECFQRRRLAMGQARFSAALGKRPAPAAAGPNQQELDVPAMHPVANRGDLFALPQLAELHQSHERGWTRMCHGR